MLSDFSIRKLIDWYAARKRWQMILPAFVGFILLMPNLGESYLWVDETDTAAIAVNILKFGLPVMNDGRNLILYYPPVYNDDYILVVSPWLSYYLTAGSFGLFGISTAAARLPFALLGVATLLLFPAVIRRLTKDPWVVMVTPLVLATSVPFLLYFRQSRYYGIMIFATMWLVWAYLRLIESDEKRTANAVHATLAAVALFHSHYLVCFGTVVTIGVHWLIGYRDRISWKTITYMSTGFAVLTIPWFIYAQSTISSTFTNRFVGDVNLFELALRNTHFMSNLVTRTGEDFVPPLLLLALVWLLVDGRHRLWQIFLSIGCLAAVGTALKLPIVPYVTALCTGVILVGIGIKILRGHLAVTPFSLTWMLFSGLLLTLFVISLSDEVRYMVGVVPFLYVGLISMFGELKERYPRVCILLLVLFLGTNLFRSAPAAVLSLLPTATQVGEALKESDWSRRMGIAQRMPEDKNLYHRTVVMDEHIANHKSIESYIYEYIYELTHTYDGPTEGISQYLMTHGAAEDTVKIDSNAVNLIFYTNMVVLPQHLFQRDEYRADWVILRHANWHNIPDAYMDTIRARYDRIELPYPDIPWENRPELSYHNFRLPQDAPRVVIYRLRDNR